MGKVDGRPLPSVRPSDPVVAILCADIHLSSTPPLARAGETDWWKAMQRTLDQIRTLQTTHRAVCICAGDVFDRWNSTPELINFALEHLPPMYAIPGQHDLPYHDMDEIRKSAFWTLVQAGVIEPLYQNPRACGGFLFHGFPWGCPIGTPGDSDAHNVAVIHRYVWSRGHSYPGAPADRKVSAFKDDLRGYDLAVFGDNHQGFLTTTGTTTVLNCGTLMRRKADEIQYRPQVGLLHRSGSVTIHYLNLDGEVIEAAEEQEPIRDDIGIRKVLAELSRLQKVRLDFREAMLRVFEEREIRKEVQKVILEAME